MALDAEGTSGDGITMTDEVAAGSAEAVHADEGSAQDAARRRMPPRLRKYLVQVQGGKLYLPAAYRIVWFRDECPDWGVTTQIVEGGQKEGYATVLATIRNAEGRIIATGHKTETQQDFPAGWVEKAECVPLSTRILTAEGWKEYTELRIGEPVLGYNIATDQLEWVPLLDLRTYSMAPVVRMWNGKGFDVRCTPDHKWAVTRPRCPGEHRAGDRRLTETQGLTAADAIITSAAAPGGRLPVTATQAFVMGMLITNGCIRYDGKGIHGYYWHEQPGVVATIRERLQNVPHREEIVAAHTRTFPTGRTSECRQAYRWHPAAAYLHELHDAFGIVHETELPRVVCGLSCEARSAMMEAMMLAHGDKKGNFAQMPGRNDWVIDLWTQLCALEGSTVCAATVRHAVGRLWSARKKRTRQIWASDIVVEDAGFEEVWCPHTPLGTWVARFDTDVVCITGNTGAIARALALAGFGTQFSPELDEDGRLADSPLPISTDAQIVSERRIRREGHAKGERKAEAARPVHEPTSVPAEEVWPGPGQCPRCHAPAGKPHGKPCHS